MQLLTKVLERALLELIVSKGHDGAPTPTELFADVIAAGRVGLSHLGGIDSDSSLGGVTPTNGDRQLARTIVKMIPWDAVFREKLLHSL